MLISQNQRERIIKKSHITPDENKKYQVLFIHKSMGKV